MHKCHQLHLNIKPKNVLINDMGVAFLGDVGFHLFTNLVKIERTDIIFTQTYLKLSKEESLIYMDPKRLIDPVRKSQVISNSDNLPDLEYSSHDLFPLVKIIENDLDIKCGMSEILEKSFRKEDSGWEISSILLNGLSKIVSIDTDYFRKFNREISRSPQHYDNTIIYLHQNWEELCVKILKVDFNKYKLAPDQSELTSQLVTSNKNYSTEANDNEILLLNFLLPSINSATTLELQLLGIEMLNKIISGKVNWNQDFILERVMINLINIALGEKKSLPVKIKCLDQFFTIVSRNDFTTLGNYNDYKLSSYFLQMLIRIWEKDNNEPLIIIILKNISIIISFSTDLVT